MNKVEREKIRVYWRRKLKFFSWMREKKVTGYMYKGGRMKKDSYAKRFEELRIEYPESFLSDRDIKRINAYTEQVVKPGLVKVTCIVCGRYHYHNANPQIGGITLFVRPPENWVCKECKYSDPRLTHRPVRKRPSRKCVINSTS